MVADDEDPKTFFSKEMAGKEPLDDEMLPNQGEPVPQEEDPYRGPTLEENMRAEDTRDPLMMGDAGFGALRSDEGSERIIEEPERSPYAAPASEEPPTWGHETFQAGERRRRLDDEL